MPCKRPARYELRRLGRGTEAALRTLERTLPFQLDRKTYLNAPSND
jgi:hypothetical protein